MLPVNCKHSNASFPVIIRTAGRVRIVRTSSISVAFSLKTLTSVKYANTTANLHILQSARYMMLQIKRQQRYPEQTARNWTRAEITWTDAVPYDRTTACGIMERWGVNSYQHTLLRQRSPCASIAAAAHGHCWLPCPDSRASKWNSPGHML